MVEESQDHRSGVTSELSITDVSTAMANEEQQSIDVVVPPEHQTGVYANSAAVSSQSPHDITLDFLQLVPGGGTPLPIVVARLKLSPSFLMPLMQVLSTHLSQHEELQRMAEGGIPDQPSPEDEEKES